jgi:cysteine desulfurase
MRVGNTIYLDHQATTPVDSKVWQAMHPYYIENFGNPHSADHVIGWAAAKAIESATTSLAELIGADPDEIIFTSGATEANNLALLGIGRRASGGTRRRILVSATEHKCVLAAARTLHQHSHYAVQEIPVDPQGRINDSTLKTLLDDDVLLVSIMAVNNEIGTIEDIVGLSKSIHAAGALFHCDAAQAPMAIDLTTIAESVDLLSLSGHKMYAPKGIGALYIRRDLQVSVEPLIYGGGQQRNLRSGTLPVPLCVGMGRACELFLADEMLEAREQLRQRRDRFLAKILSLPWHITLNGPPLEDRHPANLNLRFRGFSAADLLSAMQPRLAVSTGAACTSGIPEPSHVLRAIGLPSEDADSSIRFSLGLATSDADLDEAVEILHDTLARLSSGLRQ